MIADTRVGDSSTAPVEPGTCAMTGHMRDVVFLLVVVGFFGLAFAFLRACGLVVRETTTEERDR